MRRRDKAFLMKKSKPPTSSSLKQITSVQPQTIAANAVMPLNSMLHLGDMLTYIRLSIDHVVYSSQQCKMKPHPREYYTMSAQHRVVLLRSKTQPWSYFRITYIGHIGHVSIQYNEQNRQSKQWYYLCVFVIDDNEKTKYHQELKIKELCFINNVSFLN